LTGKIIFIIFTRMSGPQRKPDQTAISVSMSKSLLAQIDERATALGITRSQYLTQLARADVLVGGELVLRESSTKHKASSDQAAAEKKTVAIIQKEADRLRTRPKKEK
jgi:metal-responsive CopG/Arc/MetJ family transcriptional regulator